MVAVGTSISPRPPHRSQRALLTTRPPPSGQTSCDKRFSHARRPPRSHHSDRRGISAQRTHSAKTPAVAIERGSPRSRCGGFWLLACLPVPRKKVDHFIDWMIRQPGQYVGKPGLRIDVVHLASFDKCIDGGGTMAASI